MRTLDDDQFERGPISLELDVARAQPSTRAPAQPLPALPSYRRCFTHDLPMDSGGDCSLCVQTREADARKASRSRLMSFVVVGLILMGLVGGTLGWQRYEAGAQKRAAAALTERYKTPVVVFTSRTCSACNITREYLETNNVPFTERCLDGDPSAVQEYDTLAERRLVPVMIIGDEVQEGFDMLKFERAMASHNVKRLPAPRDQGPRDQAPL